MIGMPKSQTQHPIREDNNSDDDDDDSETKSHKNLKVEFEKRERDYMKQVAQFQREKTVAQATIKDLEDKIRAK